jgi:hypothetical protein
MGWVILVTAFLLGLGLAERAEWRGDATSEPCGYYARTIECD